MKSLPENKEFCQGDSDLICFFHNFLWAATKVAASTIAKPLWGFRAYQALTLAKPSAKGIPSEPSGQSTPDSSQNPDTANWSVGGEPTVIVLRLP